MVAYGISCIVLCIELQACAFSIIAEEGQTSVYVEKLQERFARST